MINIEQLCNKFLEIESKRNGEEIYDTVIEIRGSKKSIKILKNIMLSHIKDEIRMNKHYPTTGRINYTLKRIKKILTLKYIWTADLVIDENIKNNSIKLIGKSGRILECNL